MLRWFNSFNSGRDYPAQVHPFNFLTVFPARRISASDWPDLIEPLELKNSKRRNYRDLPRPVAPFNSDPRRGAANSFDRLTGEPVPINRLKTYSEALSDYHLHPEAKFLNGDYVDRGPTMRRHIRVAGMRYIGKEANRWEEQFHLGYDPEAQIEYDGGPFVGWQRQDNSASVQGALETAIEKLSGERVTVTGAGRTDAGVHALGQVAHFDLQKEFAPEKVRDALNHHVKPAPIAVLDAAIVAPDFHARFSATARHYLYRILCRRAPPIRALS